MKFNARAGTFNQFERRYQPIEVSDGTIMRDSVPAGTDYHLVWTVLDCDGKLYLGPGFHFVNRMGYVLCAVPFKSEDTRDYVY
jgi:hypothetical protein